MKPFEPGPIEVLIEKWETWRRRTRTSSHPQTVGRQYQLAGCINDIKMLPPLVPAPQWMPEGWVPEPGEIGPYWVTKNGSKPMAVVVTGDDYFTPLSATGEIQILKEFFCNYRWCPLPAAPKLEG